MSIFTDIYDSKIPAISKSIFFTAAFFGLLILRAGFERPGAHP